MPRWTNRDRTALGVIRANAGYSREKAAGIMEISSSCLFEYERGISDVPMGIAEEMVILYRVSFDVLREAIKKSKEAAGVRTVGRHKKNLTTKPKITTGAEGGREG